MGFYPRIFLKSRKDYSGNCHAPIPATIAEPWLPFGIAQFPRRHVQAALSL